MEFRDRDPDCHAAFDRVARERIKRLVNTQLIEEHRLHPVGQHSDALARVLNYFRRAPLGGKYAVWATAPLGPYRIITLSNVRGECPSFVSEHQYATIDEVYHAIFLRRLRQLDGN